MVALRFGAVLALVCAVAGVPRVAAEVIRRSGPAVATNAAGVSLVVWEQWDLRDGHFTTTLSGARVSADGSVLDPSGFLISGEEGFVPDVASDGDGFLVAWEARGSDTSDSNIRGARVTASGTVLDPDGLTIAAGTRREYSPAVASNGDGYLVVWTDSRGFGCVPNEDVPVDCFGDQIYAARVSATGAVLDGTGIDVSAHGGYASTVASDGHDYLVAWGRAPSYGANLAGLGGIEAARVGATGAVLDPLGIQTSFPGRSTVPSLAWNGSAYLVVWGELQTLVLGYDVWGARISPLGVALDPEGRPIALDVRNQILPAVASSGERWLTVWQDERPDPCCDYDVVGARVSPYGLLEDPTGFPISASPAIEVDPDISWNGTSYLVVWTDWRGGPAIFGARVSADGSVLDPAGFGIAGS